jgi:hypothetical protein
MNPATPEMLERHRNKSFPGMNVVRKLTTLTAADAIRA